MIPELSWFSRFDLTLFRVPMIRRLNEVRYLFRRRMMHIRRVLTLAVAATTLATAPALDARQNNQQPNRRDQERRSEQEQRDTQALVQMVDAIAAGKQPAPTDIAVQWEANHFMRGADGTTYVPFSVKLDAAKLAAPGVALYVRVVSKGAAAAPAPADHQETRIGLPLGQRAVPRCEAGRQGDSRHGPQGRRVRGSDSGQGEEPAREPAQSASRKGWDSCVAI